MSSSKQLHTFYNSACDPDLLQDGAKKKDAIGGAISHEHKKRNFDSASITSDSCKNMQTYYLVTDIHCTIINHISGLNMRLYLFVPLLILVDADETSL